MEPGKKVEVKVMKVMVAVQISRGAGRLLNPGEFEIRYRGAFEILKLPLVNGSVEIPRPVCGFLLNTPPKLEAWETAWSEGDSARINKVQLVSTRSGDKFKPFSHPLVENLVTKDGMTKVAGFSYDSMAVTTLDDKDKLTITECNLQRNGAIVKVFQHSRFSGYFEHFDPTRLSEFAEVVKAAKEKLSDNQPLGTYYFVQIQG